LLGQYAQASLSPHGLFVAVTRRHELLAIDPQGNVRWSLARLRRITLPRWAPDGYRIAYLDGPSLRIVAGDGTGDRSFVDAVAHVAPAWRPSIANEHVLAFSAANGELELYAIDGNALYAHHRLPAVPLQLLWSSDGARLVALSKHEISVFDHNGRPLGSIRIGRRALAAAFAPHSHRLTVILSGARSDAVSYDLDRPGHPPREVFSGTGRFSALTWSPNGRWLLIAWPTANQWLFVAHDGRATAVAGIAAQFQGNQVPAPVGWCC
jgi:Tol biopolymer transport system component